MHFGILEHNQEFVESVHYPPFAMPIKVHSSCSECLKAISYTVYGGISLCGATWLLDTTERWLEKSADEKQFLQNVKPVATYLFILLFQMLYQNSQCILAPVCTFAIHVKLSCSTAITREPAPVIKNSIFYHFIDFYALKISYRK